MTKSSLYPLNNLITSDSRCPWWTYEHICLLLRNVTMNPYPRVTEPSFIRPGELPVHVASSPHLADIKPLLRDTRED